MHHVRRTYPSVLLLLLSMSLLLHPTPAVSGTAGEATTLRPAERLAETPAAPRPVYGPILTKDPATRARIKHLYLERNTLASETQLRLDELQRAYVAETDADFRWELSHEMGELKRSLEVRNVEIGLQIARLNGQEDRAAEFARALDQLLHPENHFPVNRPDPALKEARLREHGAK